METSTLGRRLERGMGTKLLKKKRKKEAKERRRKKNKKERKEEGKGTTCQGETWRNLHSILGIIDQFDSHFYSNVTEKNVALFGINRNSVLLEEATFPFCFYPHSLPRPRFLFTFLQVRSSAQSCCRNLFFNERRPRTNLVGGEDVGEREIGRGEKRLLGENGKKDDGKM